MKFLIILMSFLLFAACQSDTLKREVDAAKNEQVVEQQGATPNSSELMQRINEFAFHHDKFTIGDFNRFYRENLSVQEGNPLQNDECNVAFQTMVEIFKLPQVVSEETLIYYIQEMNLMNNLIRSNIDSYLECLKAMEDTWGTEKIREMAKVRHEKSMDYFNSREIDSDYVKKYEQESIQLLEL